MDDTVQEPGLSNVAISTLSKGQMEHQRRVALRLWEEPETGPEIVLSRSELHPRYKQRRRRENRALLLHALGMLVVLVMLELMGKV